MANLGLRFGGFLAPHHPIGENPMLQFRRDLDLAERMDQLGFDEFWCGEHHSTGWEVISSPEMFLAAAGERTHRIKLGTGVVSLPYHHPYHVANRIVQLDHMTGGRAILGTGPGALPSDAHTLGIDPMVLRDRQDEGIGVVQRLLAGERFTYECDWFNMYDAKLQHAPIGGHIEQAVASMISPSGMTLAGKYGIGILSLGSMSTAGLQALPTQWSFAEEAAEKAGTTVDRRNWRVVINFHVAESMAEAKAQTKDGLLHWHNEYNHGTLMRPGSVRYDSADTCFEELAGGDESPNMIGDPDYVAQRIATMYETAGGFGTVIGFIHDFSSHENNMRSWDLFARYVIPQLNGMLDGFKESNQFVKDHREYFDRAGQAILAKIMDNERAAAALAEDQAKGANSRATAISAHANTDVELAD
ncbi:MAG: LLM class flavin-dependent oxidoreductase [Actinomycetota bacterium]